MTLSTIPQSAQTYLAQAHSHFIDGARVASRGSGRIDVINPSTGAAISSIANAAQQDIDDAVAAARQAFERADWRDMKPAARAALLNKFADVVEANAQELAFLEVLDGGKPVALAQPVDVMSVVTALRYYAGWADKIHGDTHTINLPGEHHSFTLKEPVGVAALIVPWNYPLVMAGMKIAPALAAGCTCVLKPAEDTPITALRLAELAIEAGLPAGALNVVTGYGREAGAMLASHPGVDKIAFTGSTATGRAIAVAAGDNLKKVTLELGGKSPNIIFPDADLAKAIPGSAYGVFFNSGQVCTAASRLYVHEDVYDEVVEGIADFSQTLKVGNGLDPDVFLGPLISQQQLNRVSSYVETGRSEGAEILCGGAADGLGGGYFFNPTVMANTTNAMTVSREEIFGPVVVAQRFKDRDEVLALANDSEYGLSSAVWTKDLSTAHYMTRRLQAGQVSVNFCGLADWDLPIGGYKQSGVGSENGYSGLMNYMQVKAVGIAV